MSNSEPNGDRERLTREAARLFMRLQDRPTDDAALRDRDAFLARGEAEREAYARAARAWTAVGRKQRPKRGGTIAVFLVLALSIAGYLSYDTVRVAFLADVQTASEPTQAELLSGDLVLLDAASAIADDTDGDVRQVRLLAGAAFFDVETDRQRFLVRAGPVTAEVEGTAFEVSRAGNAVLVAVAEGRVVVSGGAAVRMLSAGEFARVTSDGVVLAGAVDVETVAGWRADRLVTDGMTVAEVAAIIDRRLPGRVVIIGDTLAQREVSGGLDLTNPMQALRTLAAARGARLVSGVPGLILLFPGG